MGNKFNRIPFEGLAPRLQKLLGARVERLGYLGEFFQCTAVQPEILAAFVEMTEALKQALPDKVTETVALTVATVLGNDYERHQHERLSKKLGFGTDWISAVTALSSVAGDKLRPEERAVQQLVITMIERHGKDLSKELQAVTSALGPDQAVAIMFLVGRYITHALIVNALALAPPVPSIFAAVSA